MYQPIWAPQSYTIQTMKQQELVTWPSMTHLFQQEISDLVNKSLITLSLSVKKLPQEVGMEFYQLFQSETFTQIVAVQFGNMHLKKQIN